MPRRPVRGVIKPLASTHGYVYYGRTEMIVTARVMKQMFYEGPKWRHEMWLLANPWHVKRRWQVELGFKLLAVARSQSLTATVTEA